MSRDRYQTVKEVADLLKVSEVTVRRWIKGGELRAIDIGKAWRIGSEDLDAFLEGHATRPRETVFGFWETGAEPYKEGARDTKERKT